ncbi:hypothetical protein EVAR_96699_1 [Eumeta japonica]|uniref:Uncharacterized protein n=1 Tax=Eumeta variegata TaxID=151549 RepID=A0A4C1WHB7_EUMVA|nr:hypothetical protein EVAR_96699_1 [Eumeta japonica]
MSSNLKKGLRDELKRGCKLFAPRLKGFFGWVENLGNRIADRKGQVIDQWRRLNVTASHAPLTANQPRRETITSR